MSAELAAKYGDILVQCPMPGQEHLPPERLGVFLETEVGQKVLGGALANVGVLLETGMGEDQAITIALGPALVRDEVGDIMRAPVDAQEPVAQLLETVDSKKK